MSPRPRSTFGKRQKEQARQEKQQAKAQRRMQRKLEKQTQGPDPESEQMPLNPEEFSSQPEPHSHPSMLLDSSDNASDNAKDVR